MYCLLTGLNQWKLIASRQTKMFCSLVSLSELFTIINLWIDIILKRKKKKLLFLGENKYFFWTIRGGRVAESTVLFCRIRKKKEKTPDSTAPNHINIFTVPKWHVIYSNRVDIHTSSMTLHNCYYLSFFIFWGFISIHSFLQCII